MPFLLSADTIRRLNDALALAGLATPDARDELLQGIHPGFVASLPRRSSPLDQVQSDLAQMNQVPALDDGQVPLRLWLENAVSQAAALTTNKATPSCESPGTAHRPLPTGRGFACHGGRVGEGLPEYRWPCVPLGQRMPANHPPQRAFCQYARAKG